LRKDPASSPAGCSEEPLAHVAAVGWDKIARPSVSPRFSLPSVILMMIFGQTRVFFNMARDRLLRILTRIHARFKRRMW
jgi:APA family basic amino acid/polyamine antiporter